jgi:hypothetical protein
MDLMAMENLLFERNYSGNAINETNNYFRSYQDVETKHKMECIILQIQNVSLPCNFLVH